MNVILFMTLEKHNIYFVSENSTSFFIAVPNKEFSSTNISIELKGDYDSFNLNTNDLEYVKALVKDAYTNIDNYNISLVIPITENGELKEVRVDGNDISYGKLDMIIGRIINLAYSILTENGIQVNNKIVLINNEKYKNFISWFLERYKDRCEYKTYLELITITNNNSISLNKIEMTDINFVIGKEEKDPPQKPKELTNTLELDPNIVIDEIDLPTNYVNRKEENQLGYVSYCLLGIMSVIISLVLLYVLL